MFGGFAKLNWYKKKLTYAADHSELHESSSLRARLRYGDGCYGSAASFNVIQWRSLLQVARHLTVM